MAHDPKHDSQAAATAELGHPDHPKHALQGALNSPLKQIAGVPTVESLDTPIAQSTRACDQESHVREASGRLRNQPSPSEVPLATAPR